MLFVFPFIVRNNFFTISPLHLSHPTLNLNVAPNPSATMRMSVDNRISLASFSMREM
jgi:hypothetical protein